MNDVAPAPNSPIDVPPRGSTVAGRGRVIAGNLAALAVVVSLACLLVSPPSGPVTEHLDTSWKTVLGSDLIQGNQFGRDSVFQYGVLGYFLAADAPYLPELYWLRIVVTFLLGLGAAGVLVGAMRAVRPRALSIIWCAAAIIQAPGQREPIHLAALGLMPMIVAAATRPTLVWLALGGAYVAMVALTKQTLLVASAMAVAGSFVIVWRTRGPRIAGFAALIVAAEGLAIWLATRQDPRNLPAYVVGAWDAVTGYAGAMSLADLADRELLGFATGALFVLACGAGLVARLRQGDGVGGAVASLTLLGVGAVALKIGMTRADGGHHVVSNGTLMLLALATVPTATRFGDVLRGMVVALATIGFFVASESPGGAVAEALAGVRRHMAGVVAAVQGSARISLATAQLAAAQRNAMPWVSAKLGTEPVDLWGNSQGVLYLNHLNLHHRPVFQDYLVFSPELNAQNEAFFESAQAPRHLLARVATIDGRFPTVSDSATLRALLMHYRPVGCEGDYALFEREPASPALPRIPQQSFMVGFGDRLDVGRLGMDLVEISCDIQLTTAGRVRAALHRPPLLWMVATTSNGGEHRFRISSSLVRTPFILSPFVDSGSAICELYGHHRQQRVTNIRFEVESGWETAVEPHIGLTVWSDEQLWAKLAPQAAPAQAPRLTRFPTFQTPPDDVDSPATVWPLEEPEVPGVMAHANSTLSWNVGAGAWRAHGRFGMIPRAWQEGTTDGVVFIAELIRPGAPPQELWRRHLTPRQQAADRAVLEFDLPFEAPANARFVLRTDMGPAQNAEWDWSYWRDVGVERRN